MPEFRVTYPKPAEGPAVPFKVGPIPTEYEPLVGPSPEGVAVSELTDAGKCAEFGIMLGDIIVKFNAVEITDQASFAEALEAAPVTVLLSIRRPSIRLTTARLLKINYQATPAADPTSSAVGSEKVHVEVLEVTLPFADKLEETRKTHQLWQPVAADVESMKGTWFDLPAREPAVFTKGVHRVVAAASFDESLSADKGLRKAKMALVSDLEGNPLRGGGKSIDIYGVESLDKESLSGSYVTATIASAPFPINIEFKGRFRMLRVDDWSSKDDIARKAKMDSKPKEDLNKYKLAPDVPEPAKKP